MGSNGTNHNPVIPVLKGRCDNALKSLCAVQSQLESMAHSTVTNIPHTITEATDCLKKGIVTLQQTGMQLMDKVEQVQHDVTGAVPSIDVEEQIGQLESTISSKTEQIADGLRDIRKSLSGIGGYIDTEAVADKIKQSVDALVAKVDNLDQSLSHAIEKAKEAVNTVERGIDHVHQAVTEKIDVTTDTIQKLSDKVDTSIDKVQQAVNKVNAVADQILQTIEEKIKPRLDEMAGAADLSKVNEQLKAQITDEANPINQGLNEVFQSLSDICDSINPDKMTAKVKQCLYSVTDKAENIAQSVIKAVNKVKKVTGTINQAADKVKQGVEKVSDIVNKVQQSVAKVNEVIEKVEEAVDKVKKVIDKIEQTVGKIKTNADKVQQVVDNAAKTVKDAVENAQKIGDNVSKALADAKKSIEQDIAKISSKINRSKKSAQQALDSVGNGKGAFSGGRILDSTGPKDASKPQDPVKPKVPKVDVPNADMPSMGMGDSYVCSTAMIRCMFGDAAVSLTVGPERTELLEGKPQANIMDHKAFYNIPTFGTCHTLSFPATASATAANYGVLTPMPCIPGTVTPWVNGKMDYMVQGSPALLRSSFCNCMWGGTITIVHDGQMGVGMADMSREPAQQFVAGGASKAKPKNPQPPTLGKKGINALGNLKSALKQSGLKVPTGNVVHLANAAQATSMGNFVSAGIQLQKAVPGLMDISQAVSLARKAAKPFLTKVGDLSFNPDINGALRNIVGRIDFGGISDVVCKQFDNLAVTVQNRFGEVADLTDRLMDGIRDQINDAPELLGEALSNQTQSVLSRIEQSVNKAMSGMNGQFPVFDNFDFSFDATGNYSIDFRNVEQLLPSANGSISASLEGGLKPMTDFQFGSLSFKTDLKGVICDVVSSFDAHQLNPDIFLQTSTVGKELKANLEIFGNNLANLLLDVRRQVDQTALDVVNPLSDCTERAKVELESNLKDVANDAKTVVNQLEQSVQMAITCLPRGIDEPFASFSLLKDGKFIIKLK